KSSQKAWIPVLPRIISSFGNLSGENFFRAFQESAHILRAVLIAARASSSSSGRILFRATISFTSRPNLPGRGCPNSGWTLGPPAHLHNVYQKLLGQSLQFTNRRTRTLLTSPKAIQVNTTDEPP